MAEQECMAPGFCFSESRTCVSLHLSLHAACRTPRQNPMRSISRLIQSPKSGSKTCWSSCGTRSCPHHDMWIMIMIRSSSHHHGSCTCLVLHACCQACCKRTEVLLLHASVFARPASALLPACEAGWHEAAAFLFLIGFKSASLQ